jgi:phosphatidylserine/phosphatidylglycerophosphate/cardiolipin synthase-like enzyme
MVNKMILSRPGKFTDSFYVNLKKNLSFLKFENVIQIEYLDVIFEKLINEAESSLNIFAPFQVHINEKLLTDIEKAIRLGVDVKILTRYPDKREESDFEYGLIGDNIKHFDDRKNKYNYGSIHAKMMIKDRVEAYFGSGELMETSLNSNLEVGMFTDEPNIVNFLCAVFDSAWEIAT